MMPGGRSLWIRNLRLREVKSLVYVTQRYKSEAGFQPNSAGTAGPELLTLRLETATHLPLVAFISAADSPTLHQEGFLLLLWIYLQQRSKCRGTGMRLPVQVPDVSLSSSVTLGKVFNLS